MSNPFANSQHGPGSSSPSRHFTTGNNRSTAPRIDRHNSRSSSIRLEDDLSASGVGSATSKFTGLVISTLTRLQNMLPERFRPWFWLGLWFGFVGLIIGLFTAYHSKIFEFLESLATFLRNLGPFGPPVLMACLFVTSFPPMIGYSSIITMAGYVYGFVFGFAIAFSSALAGSIVCFYFCRRWFKSQVRTLMSKNKNLKSVVRTVEKRGFRLLVLIRLAPYPFNVMNALLSATHIPLPTYALATAISLFKLTLHVYIGSTLSTLTSEPDDGNSDDPNTPGKNGHSKALKIVMMVVGILLGIGVGGYVWLVAKREVAITEAIRIERRRRRRMGLGIRSNSRGNTTSDGTNGIELGPNSIPGLDLTNQGGYLDEDGDDHEGQSLFNRQFDLDPFLQHSGDRPQNDDWRNVGANFDGSTDSEGSDDFSDDDDDDDDHEGLHHDLEQGVFGQAADDDEHEDEGALDFSAHHVGLVDSPWRDDDEPELDLGGGQSTGGEDDDEDQDLVLHSSTKRGGNVW